MKRYIRPVPAIGLELVPGGAILVDGYLDYLTEDVTEPIDAVYVAEQLRDKSITVIKDSTVGLDIQGHTFAGWPATLGAVTRTVEIL